MRKAVIILAVGLVACASFGSDIDTYRFQIAASTNTTQSWTNRVVDSFAEVVYMDVGAGAAGATGICVLAWQPDVAGMAVIEIATNVITGDTVFYPVADRTDTAGAALTSDPPGKILVSGVTTWTITGINPTGLQWTCVLKTSK